MEDTSSVKKVALPSPTGYVSTTNYSNTYHTAYASHVDKVSAILTKVAAAPTSQPEVKTTALTLTPLVKEDASSVVYLSRAEIEAASKMGLQGKRGVFIPTWEENDGTIYGSLTIDQTEYDAHMRQGSALTWGLEDTVWDVSVLGMVDDGTTITALVSKPRLSLVSNTESVH